MSLLLPVAADGKRRLPLAEAARDADRVRPIYAVWEITLKCDLACVHCGSRGGRARKGELTTDEALDLIAQMAELGVLEVTLIGGEVYLRDDCAEIVRAIRDAGMSCSITTGGRAFTAERARAVQRAGVQTVSVSLDGIGATHDALRALDGSFDAAVESLANLRQAGVAVSVNSQINRANLAEIPSLLPILIEHGAHSWQVMLTTPMGRAAGHPELILEPYQMIALMPMLAALKSRARAAGIRLVPGNNIGYFGPHESALRGDQPGGHRAPCGAGRVTLGIEAHGDVKGCPSLPSRDYVGGNVRDTPLRTIWERAPALRFARDFTVENDLWGYCRSCYYADACRGGCTWTAHVLFGRRGNNPFCHHRALELLSDGKRERLVPIAAPPGDPFDHGRFDLVVEAWPKDELAAARALVAAHEETR